MKALHDSRNTLYRAPYGTIAPGEPVTLQLDICDAQNAVVTLRTWTEGQGERRYPMEEIGPISVSELNDVFTPEDVPVRYRGILAPESDGVVWYHFIITDEHGNEKRYGAREGCYGGAGQLRDWEPPSFQLTVTSREDNLSDADKLDPMFAEALVEFLRNEKTAPELAETVEAIRENRPAHSYQNAFDLLSGQTRTRLLERLGGLDDADSNDANAHEGNERACENSRQHTRLSDGQLGLAKGRLWCASLIQMLIPESPAACDDEDEYVALWECLDADCGTIARNAIDIRHALPLFEGKSIACFAANDDVFGFWRRADDGTAACVLINASLRDAHDVLVPFVNDSVSEIIAGYDAPAISASEAGSLPRIRPNASRYARVHLHQLGSAIAYFHPEQQLELPMEDGLGVLAHITSLPAEGPGTLGEPARAFIDQLAEAGVRYWQILPVNPTDEYGSPYAGISAFAGNIRLLEKIADNAAEDALANADEYRRFCEREADWLEPYACFMAIRDRRRKASAWQAWPKKYRQYNSKLLQDDVNLASRAEKWRRAQFVFERQWKSLRAYANERGVQIIGDMPIYVSADSSDVWANPEIFQLGADGLPSIVAGCPPDQFAVDGQIWGNPVYDWETLKNSGYDWWMRRLKRAFELYDWVRLDHFIGFSRYFSIPADATAKEGAYRPGPGLGFFRKAYEIFGALPIIAEDLGSITPAVRALGAACGFPGMDIVQFVDGNDPLSGYRPRPEKIAFTGTHDNQTLVGYCKQRYPELDAQESARMLADAVATCSASVCVLPLQDILALDDDARMNVPGTAKGNWIWQAEQAELDGALTRMEELVILHRTRENR